MLIGSRLKLLRSSRGITQSELGRILGVTKASICCYEKGTRTPTIENLEDLVNYFGVSADYLLGNDRMVTTNKDKPKSLKEARKSSEIINVSNVNSKSSTSSLAIHFL